MFRSIFAAMVALLPITVSGQSYEKNSLPCVSEICIGDGLMELSKVEWDLAKDPRSFPAPPDVPARRVAERELKHLKELYRGNVAQAAPYLQGGAFDTKGLALLKGVTAACAVHAPEGSFSSQHGNSTKVQIALVPDDQDVGLQRWTVTQISRLFPEAKSHAQQVEIKKELQARYRALDFTAGPLPRKTDGRFMMNMGGTTGFILSRHLSPELSERYRLHPAARSARFSLALVEPQVHFAIGLGVWAHSVGLSSGAWAGRNSNAMAPRCTSTC